MAQGTRGAGGAAVAGTTWVVPGEVAARVDRLPMSLMAWGICLMVQLGWSTSAATAGIARTLYPFLWLPHHDISSFEYSVLFALQTGISVLIGGYFIGWLSDKIGRRKALIMSSLLAAVFIWPFGYVTNFPALFFLSIGETLGFAGYLAVNVAYMTEMTGPAIRGKVIMGSQAAAMGIGLSVLTGLIPHYLIPGQYRAYLWLLAGLNLLVAVVLFRWLPESPRWLEARGRRHQSRKVVERMEARVMERHPVLPEPDLTPHQVVAEEKTSVFAVFSKQYAAVTILLLLVMVLGYGGITYGNTGYNYLFLAENRGYSAGFVFALTFWAGVVGAAVYLLNALLGDRIERRYAQLIGAILFALAWFGIYNVHNTPALVVLFIAQETGVVLWLWSMYVYIPNNFPTRMRSLGTGWTDGVGHLGAWGGVLLAGQIFVATAPLGWVLLITIPGALIPALMIAIFGKRQHRRVLEELAR
jgi:putative MFS transporter